MCCDLLWGGAAMPLGGKGRRIGAPLRRRPNVDRGSLTHRPHPKHMCKRGRANTGPPPEEEHLCDAPFHPRAGMAPQHKHRNRSPISPRAANQPRSPGGPNNEGRKQDLQACCHETLRAVSCESQAGATAMATTHIPATPSTATRSGALRAGPTIFPRMPMWRLTREVGVKRLGSPPSQCGPR